MDYELIFWIVSAIAGIIAFAVICGMVKRNSENYIDWVVD